MALPDVVAGADYRGLTITWQDEDGTAVDLTGATLSGVYRNKYSGTVTAITGTLALSNAAGGVFTWAFSAADVATAGTYEVQFTATYTGSKYDKTYLTSWVVREAPTV